MKTIGSFLEVPLYGLFTSAFLLGPFGICCKVMFLASSEPFVLSHTILQMERDCYLVS